VNERAEDVRVSVSELPKLEIKKHERDLALLLSGDWLAMISPAMKDISSTSSIWWSQAVDAATSYYQHWLMYDP
ncbi:GIP, partial [Symbiodinium sp. CCMP2592]